MITVKHLSNTISCLHYLLIILVVIIHSRFYNSEMACEDFHAAFPVASSTSTILSSVIAQSAVPAFFLISGFLFFGMQNTFTKEDYLKKIKKRISSLVIPYVLWNCIYILYLVVAVDNLGGGKFLDYSIGDWLWCFWDKSHVQGSEQCPIYIYMWFLRDLFVACLISPLIYYLFKINLLPYVSGLLFVIWVATNDLHFFALSLCSFCFFSIGAMLSLYKYNIARFHRYSLTILGIVYSAIILTILFLNICEVGYTTFLQNICTAIGVVFILGIVSLLVEKGCIRPCRLLVSSAFFIYLSHGILVGYVRHARKLLPQSDLFLTIGYIVTPFITIVILLVAFKFMSSLTPRLLGILTGGRSK